MEKLMAGQYMTWEISRQEQDSSVQTNLESILTSVQLSCDKLVLQNHDKVSSDLAPLRFIDYKKFQTNWLDCHLLELLPKFCEEICAEKFGFSDGKDYVMFCRFSKVTIFEIYGLPGEKDADSLFDSYLEFLQTFKMSGNLKHLEVPATKSRLRGLDTVKYGLNVIFSGEKCIGVGYIQSTVYLKHLNPSQWVLVEVKVGFYTVKVVDNEGMVKKVIEMVFPSGPNKEEYCKELEKKLEGKKREEYPTVIQEYLNLLNKT